MKSTRRRELLEKYQSGDSTLLEERQLLGQDHVDNSSLSRWGRFINAQRIEMPDDLADLSWQGIERRQKVRKRRMIWVAGIAASLLILASVFTWQAGSQSQDLETKKALLKEALSMVEASERSSDPQDIIYEDELIVIYTN